MNSRLPFDLRIRFNFIQLLSKTISKKPRLANLPDNVIARAKEIPMTTSVAKKPWKMASSDVDARQKSLFG